MTRAVLKELGVFLVWNIAIGLAIILLPPAEGVLVVLLLSGWLLFRYVLRRGKSGQWRRWALLRLRPLTGPALQWTIIGIPFVIAASWALGEVYTRLIPVPPENFNTFGALTSTPLGRLALAILAVAIAPILEEFFFRGLIQRRLERHLGPARGIGIAAGLFAAVHLLPWIFPLHFFLGVALGYAVYITRSIWAGVILHAANNGIAMVAMGAQSDEALLSPTLWEAGLSAEWWFAVAVLLVGGIGLAWTVRGLRTARTMHV
ncbi:MAG TPA: type II CAAX endopeptidase family protein [Longimicrobiaceae bacterium]|nr:type II CAAX endopeptidase family protein [Longimicrobiaceae bacterium]